ncbi:hypothetical protein ACQEVB_11745 [Pseudonocardia sp. CA-107938]|uniref:hypothetical protein n=1 Tax=Pseudonocardia sp. CA-107938 TaxID=3240021 RepID=UPI003D8FE66A
MKIHEAVQSLIALAQRLPDGPDTEVVVHICGGPNEQAVWTTEFSFDEERLYKSATMELEKATAIVSVHPHRDPNLRTARPLDVDDELDKILGEEPPA